MTPTRVFVCGMVRSGTSLAQILLTNHPDMLVAYQPFHQLYVDAKQKFLDEHGIHRTPPLDAGDPSGHAERTSFLHLLSERRFDAAEAEELSRHATQGKGGGLPEWQPPAMPAGSFFDILGGLHFAMAIRLGRPSTSVLGSKEVLCEEYVPAMLSSGIRCVLIIRDPRGVIASANHGRYRAQVGDRYPLMMLIRLWRKSAAYWLQYRGHPLVYALRYEDLATDPAKAMARITGWLGAESFPPRVFEEPLRDHAGHPWLGNSSFGDKASVHATSGRSWRAHLGKAEHSFIAACTLPELRALGYQPDDEIGPDHIMDFHEDAAGVRQSYLDLHPLDMKTRRSEAYRLQRFGARQDLFEEEARQHFLFPEALLSGNPSPAVQK